MGTKTGNEKVKDGDKDSNHTRMSHVSSTCIFWPCGAHEQAVFIEACVVCRLQSEQRMKLCGTKMILAWICEASLRGLLYQPPVFSDIEERN